jgi:transglutaminase-like putative cysteine protease
VTGVAGRAWRTLAPTLAAALLYVAAAAFSIWHLRLLEQPSMGGLVRIAGLAGAPALLAALPGRRAVVRRYLVLIPPSLVIAIGVATGRWPSRHLIGRTGYLPRVRDVITHGLDRWVHTVLPYDPARVPALHDVVVLAIFLLLAALAAALIVFRAPFAAAAIAFVPFVVVSTVYRLSSQTLRAALMLAVVLAVIGVLAPRARRFGQLVAGAIAVIVAMGAVTLPGVAKAQFFDWQHVGKRASKGDTVAYVWNQTYGPLQRPKEATTLLRVRSAHPAYLRTTVLDAFDGLRWVETPSSVAIAPGPTIAYGAEVLSPNAVDQLDAATSSRVENVGLETTWLPAPTEVVGLSGIPAGAGPVSRRADGALSLAHPLPLGATYSVSSVAPAPTSLQLQRARIAPDEAERQLLDVQVTFPAWGTPGREAVVAGIFDQWFFDPALVRWKEAYARAYELTRKATNPYEVVIALEIEFQRSYRYDEKADYSHAVDGPLPAFLLGAGKNGYCQMFSGAMATLLRMLGIPARVAEGFTEGRRATGSTTAEIDDRAAHAWVEVAFETYGWVPFEPTPTRTLPGTYSSSNPRFALGAKPASGGGKSPVVSSVPRIQCFVDGTCNGKGGTRSGPGGANRTGREGAGGTGATPSAPYRPGFVVSLLLVAVALVLGLLAAKRIQLWRGRLRSDPHGAAAEARSELERYVLDQGVTGPIRTLTAEEFAVMLHREFGVDARTWASVTTRARYGPATGSGHEVAGLVRREARGVRRDIAGRLTRAERALGAIRVRSLLR